MTWSIPCEVYGIWRVLFDSQCEVSSIRHEVYGQQYFLDQ
jgi:hypothetical protein